MFRKDNSEVSYDVVRGCELSAMTLEPRCVGLGGTSGAAPQVSALARMLYHLHPGRTYRQVWNRIVSTRDDTKSRGHIAGLVDYGQALEGW